MANVSHLDPTPEITLANFAKRNEDMVIKTKELDNQGDQLGNMKVVVDSLLRPKTKLAELESRKMSRSAARLRDESGETREDAVNTAVTLDRLADEIQGKVELHLSRTRGSWSRSSWAIRSRTTKLIKCNLKKYLSTICFFLNMSPLALLPVL